MIGVRQVAGLVLRRFDHVGEHFSVRRYRRSGVGVVGRDPTAALGVRSEWVSHSAGRGMGVVDVRTGGAGAQAGQIDGADQDSVNVVSGVGILQIVGDPQGLIIGRGIGRSGGGGVL